MPRCNVQAILEKHRFAPLGRRRHRDDAETARHDRDRKVPVRATGDRAAGPAGRPKKTRRTVPRRARARSPRPG